MSRYDKPTPPDRPAALRYDAEETPVTPYSESLPLRGPTRLGQSAQRRRYDEAETNPEGLSLAAVRTEVTTLRAEVHRQHDAQRAMQIEMGQQACDLASIQSQLLGSARGPSPMRKRWSDAPSGQRAITAIVTAVAVSLLTALAQRYGVAPIPQHPQPGIELQ